jgi:UTP:GlnB (protein PII) uridylyltransferase
VTDLELDHLQYIRHQPYRRVHARLRRLSAERPQTLSLLTVLHEADNRCCNCETWPTSYVKLLGSLADDGERVLGVVL